MNEQRSYQGPTLPTVEELEKVLQHTGSYVFSRPGLDPNVMMIKRMEGEVTNVGRVEGYRVCYLVYSPGTFTDASAPGFHYNVVAPEFIPLQECRHAILAFRDRCKYTPERTTMYGMSLEQLAQRYGQL